MQSAMVQFRHRGGAPSLDEVRRLFGLAPDELDPAFGVIATDPDDGLYAVLIADTAIPRVSAALAARPADPAEGVFANPRIEPTE
jgi:hypothetical protein